MESILTLLCLLFFVCITITLISKIIALFIMIILSIIKASSIFLVVFIPMVVLCMIISNIKKSLNNQINKDL